MALTATEQQRASSISRSRVSACVTWRLVLRCSTFDGQFLHSASLSAAAVRRQTESPDAAPSPDTGAQNIVGVQVVSTLRKHGKHTFISKFSCHGYAPPRLTFYLHVCWVEVGLVFVCGFVSSVSCLDHGVQQLFEDFVRLLVSGDAAHGHDEGVS